MKSYNFKYRTDKSAEEQMFTDIKVLFGSLNINRRILNNIYLAISEAFTNALSHGNNWDNSKIVELVLVINDREICADIIDQGSCDPASLIKRPCADLMAEGGRGLDLVENCADEVNYCRDEQTGGLKVSMKFSISSEVISQIDIK